MGRAVTCATCGGRGKSKKACAQPRSSFPCLVSLRDTPENPVVQIRSRPLLPWGSQNELRRDAGFGAQRATVAWQTEYPHPFPRATTVQGSVRSSLRRERPLTSRSAVGRNFPDQGWAKEKSSKLTASSVPPRGGSHALSSSA